VLITNTHSVGVVRDAFLAWLVKNKRSPGTNTFDGGFYTYPIVAETYDGTLNDINGFHVKPADVEKRAAIGGGRPRWRKGTWAAAPAWSVTDSKAGSGRLRASWTPRRAGIPLACWCSAIADHAGNCALAALPVGEELTNNPPRASLESPYREDVGSIIIVVATDAPLLPHQVQRLARRATMGLARTGSTSGNGSGDIFIAFSTANRNAAAAKARST